MKNRYVEIEKRNGINQPFGASATSIMRLLTPILLLASFQLDAQIINDPYVVGQYRNDVVYIGTYQSPGNCTFNDGTDFVLNFSGLSSIDGLEYVLIIDEPNPSNTSLMNGWLPVSVGDSTTFNSSTTSLGISAASGQATINFHVRLVGTPTTPNQEYPCWITEGVTEAVCGNTYALFPGESLIPCYVTGSVGIAETELPVVEIRVEKGGIYVTNENNGVLSIFGMDGRIHVTKNMQSGFTHLGLSQLAKGNYIVRFDGSNGTYSQKILLQ
jgi:type 1 fimbria pilin